MPWTGSGTFERTDGTRTGSALWQDARDAAQPILAEDHDAHDEDVVDGLEACLTRNGETTPTADTSWNSKKITSLGAATARNDAMRLGQFQDGAVIWGGTTAGTANAQTISLSPAITAYVAGMTIRVFVGITNTGSLTLSVNGLDAKTILSRGGSALQAGEWRISSLEEIVFDGTDFRLVRSFTRRRFVTASETYTIEAGLIALRTRGCGAGGGGGGAGASNTAGGGGGAGAVVDHWFKKADLGSSVSITIGAAGTAGDNTGGNGGNGGDTIFGALWTAGGGVGGTGMAASSANAQAAGGAGGTVTGTVDIGIVGGVGAAGRLDGDGRPGGSNYGGVPAWEYATLSAIGTNGQNPPTGYGAGGGGANRTSGAAAGNAGRPGAIELFAVF